MSKPLKSRSRLALLGGTPLGGGLPEPVWPPRSSRTAEKLQDLYWRGKWSFSLDGQEAAFCEEFAAAHDARYGIFMANGTVSLQCALAAFGIGPGDDVIVPALTCTTCVMPIHNLGARAVFVDVDPTTFCLDPVKAAAALSACTKAILPVHLYGALADMDAILALAGRHDLVVIEDCAHVHGAKWNRRGIGSLGHVGSFSFHQKKPMASGEGGICITNDARVAEHLHRMIHIGYARGEYGTGRKSRPPAGLRCSNLSATEFQALLLRDQLAALDHQLARYDQAVSRLRERLQHVAGVRLQTAGRRAGPQAYNKLMLIFDEAPLRAIPLEVLRRAIAAEGLPVGLTYGAVYQDLQFTLQGADYVLPAEGCPIAETIATRHALVLNHPWLGLGEKDIDVIAAILAKVAASAGVLRQLTRQERLSPSDRPTASRA